MQLKSKINKSGPDINVGSKVEEQYKYIIPFLIFKYTITLNIMYNVSMV